MKEIKFTCTKIHKAKNSTYSGSHRMDLGILTQSIKLIRVLLEFGTAGLGGAIRCRILFVQEL